MRYEARAWVETGGALTWSLRRLVFLMVLALVAACGARTELDVEAPDGREAPDGGTGPACEQLRVVGEPETLWESSPTAGYRGPNLTAHADGFELIATRTNGDHSQGFVRHVRLLDGGSRFELGPPQHVLQNVHGTTYSTSSEGRVVICAPGDPRGGSLEVLLRSYTGAFASPIDSQIPSSSACHGIIPTPDGYRLAYLQRVDRATRIGLTVVVNRDMSLGEPVQPLADMDDIEATIRIAALDDGYVWLKRTSARNVYYVGVQRDSGELIVARHEARLGAFYLRAERWPMADGAIALSYIDTTDETVPGTPVLIVTDDEGRELFRHTGAEMPLTGYIETSMVSTPHGLLRVMPETRDGAVFYRVELFTEGAARVGEAVVIEQPGRSASRSASATRAGLFLLAWDRRPEMSGRDEIAGVVLRCGPR